MSEHAKHIIDGQLAPMISCAECAEALMLEGFRGAAGEPSTVTCPACGHSFDPQEGAVRMTEAAFDSSKHPRAAAGTANGGQFAPLSYNAKKNTGSGYGIKKGDANVTRLQRALNRLKITDSHGRPLEVDGKLGPLTTSSVIKAKRLLGIKPANGKVTPDFLAKLTSTRKLPAAGHAGKAGHAARGKKGKPAAKAAPPARKTTTTRRPPVEVHLNEADVPYADPGYQADKKKRYPLDTEEHVRAAWSYINQRRNAAKYTEADLKKVKGRIRAAARRLGIQTTEAAQQAVEAHVNGSMSFDDIRGAVGKALEKRVVAETGKAYVWCYVADLTTTDVVYACGSDELMQCSYSIDDAGQVELGEPESVVRTYMPLTTAAADDMGGGLDDADAEVATEAGPVEESDRIEGRVVEAKSNDESGGRVFRVRIIAYGDSKNRRRYPESVMRPAAPMYEGAKTYDHHRTDEELRTSTIQGLIGSYRNVEAEGDGIYGDLHLLPSATHAAEALDASLAAQEQGLAPLVGVSHDVMATYKPLVAGGRRMQEATAIVKVQSADLVADPAAGGKATRMVAGGEDGTGAEPAENEEEGEVAPTKDDILGALAEASDEELAGVGLARAVENNDGGEGGGDRTTEAEVYARHGVVGRMLISQKVTAAQLPATFVESITKALPERITEADVDNQIASVKTMFGELERAGLAPTATVQVTQEAREKKIAALDAFFTPNDNSGYRSFREAYLDFTGHRPRGWDDDLNKRIMRESVGFYDSGDRLRMEEGALRLRESMDSSTWNLVLGDSITRRLVAEYSRPSLQTWQLIVSAREPVADFRTQRIDRVGGYGTLPAVAQAGTYQPLTSPTNEEATYAITKRGGTEDLTLEMVANDDVRAIAKIPMKLGLAAAQTLYRFVWDILPTNAAVTYDSTALFHTNHANTAAAALSQSALSAVRAAMRGQTAYGDASDVLSIIPKFLVVPSALEELAFQLCTSAVAIPGTPAGPSDTPNLHQGMKPIVIDYYSDTNDWYTVCDPSLCPTIAVGFYQGRETPELFTQSDPTVGSMFDADKTTYKIRHIYSGTVLDHRGFARRTQ